LNRKKLCALIGFSAGALFGAALFVIFPESFQSLNLLEAALGAISGYILFWAIGRYYFSVCPACSASHFDEHTTHKISEIVLLMLTALAFHSFFDGIALTHSDHSHFHGQSIFAAIAIHKFPEGLALASLMLGANYEKTKIILYVILVELTTVLGAVIGIVLFESILSDAVFGLVMAHIGGGFIYLSVHAIMGEMLKNYKGLVFISFLLGAAIIAIPVLVFNVH
jgi:ZIP family zinc transporter/zinc and cadmium transporter